MSAYAAQPCLLAGTLGPCTPRSGTLLLSTRGSLGDTLGAVDWRNSQYALAWLLHLWDDNICHPRKRVNNINTISMKSSSVFNAGCCEISVRGLFRLVFETKQNEIFDLLINFWNFDQFRSILEISINFEMIWKFCFETKFRKISFWKKWPNQNRSLRSISQHPEKK